MSVCWKLPPGMNEIKIVLDPQNILNESDEDNNQTTVWMDVPHTVLIDDFEYEDLGFGQAVAGQAGLGVSLAPIILLMLIVAIIM